MKWRITRRLGEDRSIVAGGGAAGRLVSAASAPLRAFDRSFGPIVFVVWSHFVSAQRMALQPRRLIMAASRRRLQAPVSRPLEHGTWMDGTRPRGSPSAPATKSGPPPHHPGRPLDFERWPTAGRADEPACRCRRACLAVRAKHRHCHVSSPAFAEAPETPGFDESHPARSTPASARASMRPAPRTEIQEKRVVLARLTVALTSGRQQVPRPSGAARVRRQRVPSYVSLGWSPPYPRAPAALLSRSSRVRTRRSMSLTASVLGARIGPCTGVSLRWRTNLT